MLGIDSSIVEHEIKMYPDVKLVGHWLQPIHLKKDATTEEEVEKPLWAGFIYPIPLTDWVSNTLPIMKKQGTIRVCVDYRDVNQACPKDNYLHLLSTILLMNVPDAKYSHLWMDFPATIRSIFAHRTNRKQILFVHRAHSPIGNSHSV